MDINWPGEKLVIKLWETLAEKGIGSLLKPGQIKREGKAIAEVQAEAKLIITQAERDAEEIRIGKKSLVNGKLTALPSSNSTSHSNQRSNWIEPYIDADGLTSLVVNNKIEEAIRKEVNVSKAVAIAEANLAEDSQEPPENNVNEDWLYRWRDYAGDVSIEELQSMWGNLLAGEIKSPGRFSLRTLEFLRNLSQEEAEKIAKLARFAIAGFIYAQNKELLSNEGLHYGFLSEMQDLGIISGIEAVGLTMTLGTSEEGRYSRALASNGKVLLAFHDDLSKQLSLNIYQVTKLGFQIFRLGTFEPHIEYLKVVGENIKAQGFRVLIADITYIDDNLLSYENENLL